MVENLLKKIEEMKITGEKTKDFLLKLIAQTDYLSPDSLKIEKKADKLIFRALYVGEEKIPNVRTDRTSVPYPDDEQARRNFAKRIFSSLGKNIDVTFERPYPTFSSGIYATYFPENETPIEVQLHS